MARHDEVVTLHPEAMLTHWITGKSAVILGAGLWLAAFQTPAGSPASVENIALAFSGLALIWFGATMLKVRDTVIDLKLALETLKTRTEHLEKQRIEDYRETLLLRRRYHRIVGAMQGAGIAIHQQDPRDLVDDDDGTS